MYYCLHMLWLCPNLNFTASKVNGNFEKSNYWNLTTKTGLRNIALAKSEHDIHTRTTLIIEIHLCSHRYASILMSTCVPVICRYVVCIPILVKCLLNCLKQLMAKIFQNHKLWISKTIYTIFCVALLNMRSDISFTMSRSLRVHDDWIRRESC